MYLYKPLLGNPALPRLHLVTPDVYPHLVDFTGKLNFPNKTRPTHSESQNKAKNIPLALSSSCNQYLRQIGPGAPEL